MLLSAFHTWLDPVNQNGLKKRERMKRNGRRWNKKMQQYVVLLPVFFIAKWNGNRASLFIHTVYINIVLDPRVRKLPHAVLNTKTPKK